MSAQSKPTPIPSIAFIGAGRVANTLSRAFVVGGIPVAAIASRNPDSAARLAATVDGSRAVAMDEAAREALVFVTVPDDDIATVCSGLKWRTGQQVVHCSGATDVSALDSARRHGAEIGGFHPLQIFSDPDRAIGLLAGATVAIEGPSSLVGTLTTIALRLRMQPLTLPAGARGAYHGGASFAASFLVSMIDEAVAMWKTFGIDEADALDALLPLARGTVEAIATRGVAGAVSGPISRGDIGVIGRHLAAFDRHGADHLRFYRELAHRQVGLAVLDGRLDDAAARRVTGAIDTDPS
ncbi:MAG: DUF2520 domain-containing protein [Burkholderiaceae bacterium]